MCTVVKRETICVPGTAGWGWGRTHGTHKSPHTDAHADVSPVVPQEAVRQSLGPGPRPKSGGSGRGGGHAAHLHPRDRQHNTPSSEPFISRMQYEAVWQGERIAWYPERFHRFHQCLLVSDKSKSYLALPVRPLPSCLQDSTRRRVRYLTALSR